MEYVQERVTTLHDLTDPSPSPPPGRTAVVVPMTDREYAGLAAERTLRALRASDPETVVVPLRVPRERVGPFREWLDGFDLPVEPVWCNAPAVEQRLAEAGVEVDQGKGRDVWLALGVAADRADHVAVVDADARTFSESHVPRLLAPLPDHEFSKGYYARVENDRLYGRLFRLLYVPLVRTLAARHAAPVVEYLDAFRYALAGEFAATADLVRRLRVRPGWGLEVGTLGEAFEHAGFDGSAQVDLGRHEHDHRAVSGPTGLSEMSRGVAGAVLRTVEEAGLAPDYDDLAERYRTVARRLVDQYAADAAFNDLDHDAADERQQVDRYAESVAPPGPDRRLPAWRGVDLAPDAVLAASREAVDDADGPTVDGASDPDGSERPGSGRE